MVVIACFILVSWRWRGIDGKDYYELSLMARYAIIHGPPYNHDAYGIAHAEATGLPASAAEYRPGFLYPPALIPIIAPCAFFPFEVGVRLWFLQLTAAALASIYFLHRFSGSGRLATSVALVLLFGSSVTQSAFQVGQVAMLIAPGVAIGVVCYRERRWLLGGIAWSVIAMKPQMGIPFLALALASGGWRGLGVTAFSMGLLTLIGAALTRAPIEALTSYLPHATATAYKFDFNLVTSDQIVSWNRAAYVMTGRELNLTGSGILAGFGLFLLAAWLREFWTRRPCSVAYWLAVSAIAGPVFGQSKGYDLVVLILWMPYILQAARAGRWTDLAVLLAAIVVIGIPRSAVASVCAGTGYEPWILSYRTWMCLLMTGWILIRGPILVPEKSTVPAIR